MVSIIEYPFERGIKQILKVLLEVGQTFN